mmetsp:Transcript_17728/g.26849  ORF Transcript_17728/g.26849 Transcript_17728/m.26849 type:complete len:577 (+) Transcript_17728:187-1917(+)
MKRGRPLTIGVFAGSFNPIHLGHSLLAITTQQTKPLDKVILVPTYKHAVKKDLLPFDDRVAMCKLAVAPFASQASKTVVEVSTIERETGASNGVMLRALRQKYPQGTKLMYICGDDFFRWFERPSGLKVLDEVDGLIVQRRLHKQHTADRFYKQPFDEDHIRSVCARLNLELDFIYGELPHFSSTLVRRTPGNWRSFLPQSVSAYLAKRPQLLERLIANLEADAMKEIQEEQRPATSVLRKSPTPKDWETPESVASQWVMRGLVAVHLLQLERGHTALWLSTGDAKHKQIRSSTDSLISEISSADVDQNISENFDEVQTLIAELRQIPIWLHRDRDIVEKKHRALIATTGIKGWNIRFDIIQKFSARNDLLIEATIRAVKEIREYLKSLKSNSKSISNSDNTNCRLNDDNHDSVPELLRKWCYGKEALGRERAFVASGGPLTPAMLRASLRMRNLLNETIASKDRKLARVLSFQEGMSTRLPAAPDALHRMLEKVTESEWSLMGCFAPSTPLSLVHKLLSTPTNNTEFFCAEQQREVVIMPASFDVEQFFQSASSAIDFLLSFAQALAAAGCASID